MISKAIEAVMKEENIPVTCEINVLVTDDEGIRAVNRANRDLDKTTDVLSFPMFQLVPGEKIENWDEYLDPETGLCPLGDMCISLQRAQAQAKAYGHSLRRENRDKLRNCRWCTCGGDTRCRHQRRQTEASSFPGNRYLQAAYERHQ